MYIISGPASIKERSMGFHQYVQRLPVQPLPALDHPERENGTGEKLFNLFVSFFYRCGLIRTTQSTPWYNDVLSFKVQKRHIRQHHNRWYGKKGSEKLVCVHTFKSGNSITQAHSTTWAPTRSDMKKKQKNMDIRWL